MIKLKDLVNERSLVGDEYYGTAYLNYPVRKDGTIDLYRSVEKDAHSSGKKYGIKKYDYYLIIRDTGRPGYVVDTNTHILDKAGRWAQRYIKRKLGGTGKERFL